MLSKIKSGKIQGAQKIVLYGVEKIGKTSLAAKFPAPLFIDTERGTRQLALDRFEVTTMADIDEAIADVLNEKHTYKTVVIDSIDWAEKIISDRVLAKNRWDSIETPGYGKGFTALREAFDIFLFSLDPIIRKGLNVVLIGHAQIKRFNPPEATDGYDRWELKLDPKNSLKVKEWADAILFVAFETKVVESGGRAKGIGGRERVIYTTHAAAYDAGNRHGLPEKIRMDVGALAPLFAANQGGEDPIPDPAPQEVRSTNSTESPAEKTLRGTVEKAWTSEFKGNTYYFATVNGRQLQTTNHELGEDLQNTGGLEIIATVKPSGKPNKYYLEAFKYPEVAKTVETEVVK